MAFVAAQLVGAAAPFFAVSTAHAAPQCITDTAGANDEPNQKDLTKLCVDYANQPVSVQTTWNWDDKGSSGANTLDACSLFDTDGDGFINYSVCVTTTGTTAVLDAVTTYSCGDTKVDRCTSPATPISNGATTCTVNQTTDDPFVTDDYYPTDTQASCTIDLSTVGGANSKLIDVCSYPSGQPNSDPSDCVVAIPGEAKLTVVKSLVPSSDTGKFDLKIDNTTYASDVGDGGTTGIQIVTAGSKNSTHTVLEQANSGSPSSLSDYSTSVVCKDQHGTGTTLASGSPTGSSTRQQSVTVAPDSDVVCTFTNTRANGHITVTKVVNNQHGGAASASQFPLYVNNTQVTSGASNSYTANQSYTVSESGGPAGYSQTSLSCKADGDSTELGATFTLAANANVNCTITNTDVAPTLTLKKVVVGGTATPANFQGTVDGGNVAWNSATTVNAGQTYTLSEAALAGGEGYTGGSWSCDGGSLTGNQIKLGLAQNVTCTITNTRDTGTLTINKVINPTNDTGLFNLTMTGPTNFTKSDQGNGGSTGAQSVDTGSYTVSESADTNTSLGDYSSQYVCMDGNSQLAAGASTMSASFSVAKDHNVVCTFTNTRFGSITGTKTIVNSDGSLATNGNTDPSGWTVFLDSNGNGRLDSGELFTTTDGSGNFSFNHLLPDTYSIVEVLTNGWTQIYNPNGVTLGAGDNSTDNDFGNFQNASISGSKFNDLNGNGQWDKGEPTLNGWTINLTGTTAKGAAVSDSATTSGQGTYSFHDLAPGNYTVCEDINSQTGYSQTYPGGNGCHSVAVTESGKDYSGNDFGNQAYGTITVSKNLDDGFGHVTSDVSGWTWNFGGSYGSGDNKAASTQHHVIVAAGTYDVTENNQTGYHFGSLVCDGVDQQGSTGSVTVTAGSNVSCVFTNVRDTGNLVLKKYVINDSGGTAVASDFTLHVKQNGADVAGSPAAGSEMGTSYTLTTGTYTVSEDTPTNGYQMTDITCDNQSTDQAVVTSGQTVTCTITNNDIAPHLTVIKHVINDNSGTSSASDFELTATSTNGTYSTFGGSETGVTVMMNAGAYNVTEGSHDGYNVSYSTDCTGTLSLNETKVCTVTNNDVPHPGIHVVKSGPSMAHEGDTVAYTFTVTNTGDTPLDGITVSDNIAGDGAYQSGDTNSNGKLDLTETWVYTKDYTIPSPQTVNVDNTVTVCGNDTDSADPTGKSCDTDTHTLDVIHPSITVKKYGPAYAYENETVVYTFTVTNTGDTPLHNVGIDDDIALGEVCDDNYLNPGDSTQCSATYTIPAPTSDDVTNHVVASGTDPLDRTVTANDQHTLDVIHPSIHVVKSGPATAHEGDTVTYTFTVTNTGDTPLSGVTVADNIAGNANYVSGDTNNDGKLDLNETWIFTKNYTIPTPQTDDVVNTATACGYDPIQVQVVRGAVATCDTDTHTLDVLHPSLQVVKSGPATAYEGDTVTYTFTVTNTGDTPLDITKVNDDVAGDGAYQSGDANHNGKLDLTETWVYTKDYTVPAPSGDISNTVTVCADDSLQGEACDTDHHTTHIYHPYITVTKYVYTSQASDDGTFNLQIDSNTKATGGDGTTTGDVLVMPGDHMVGETSANGTDLSDYDSFVSCSNESAEYYDSDVATSLSGIPVSKDQHVYCSIYNIRHAHLTVVKDAVPDDPQQFSFTLEKYNPCQVVYGAVLTNLSQLDQQCDNWAAVDNFQLVDNTDPAQASKIESLSAADFYSESDEMTYRVTEADTPGWDLTDLDCGDVEVTYDGASATLTLQPGQDVTCTYTNTKRGSVTIVKDAQPDSKQRFDFTTSLGAAFSLVDDGSGASSQTFNDVVPGTYTVTEDSTLGWDLKSVDCGDGVTMSLSGRTLTITVSPGANVTCTFTNAQKPQGHVLGASTQLTNTGNNALVNVIAGLVVISAALGLWLFGGRRQTQE
jgi:uncharacterized repeat protein (TIGR01451 family)